MNNKALIVGLFLMLVSTVNAYVANNWKADANGNWNGRYSDVNHWSRGHLPKVDEDAVFDNTSGNEYTVEIDIDVDVNDGSGPEFFKIGSAATAATMRPMVKLIGNGTIRDVKGGRDFFIYGNRQATLGGNVKINYEGAIPNYPNRKIVITDNVDIKLGRDLYVGATNEFIISSGKICADRKIVLAQDSKWTQTGGRVTSPMISFGDNVNYMMQGGEANSTLYFNNNSNGSFRLTGGTFNNMLASGFAALPSTFVFEISGTGRMVESSSFTLVEPRVLPKTGGVYDYKGSTAYALQLNGSFTNELSGSAFFTNMSAEAWSRYEGTEHLLYGGGRLCCDTIYFKNAGKTVFDLSRLDLKTRIYSGEHEMIFPRNVTIGAFGNWIYYSVNELPTTFETEAIFDTRNFITGASHNWSIKRIKPVFGNAFGVTGGGTVTIAFVTPGNAPCVTVEQPFLRSLSLGESSKVAFDQYNGVYSRNGRDGIVRWGDANLGLNSAIVSCDIAKQSLEFASKLENVDTVTITGTAKNVAFAEESGNMTGGGLCWAVISASGGEGIPLENVTITDMPVGTKLKKVGPVIYAVNYAAQALNNTSATAWTGTVNGNWNEPGNWLGNKVPASNEPANFTMCDTTNIITIPDSGVTISRIAGGGVHNGVWIRNSEPYIFKGGKIKITSNKTQNYDTGIADCGKMPKIFECDVEGPTTGNFGLNTHNFFSFNKGLKAVGLCGSGDIRIGGTAVCDNWNPMPKYTQARTTSLTVHSGGSATFTNQSTPIKEVSGFHVLGGSTLTFDGAYGLRYTGTVENKNIIDGQLKVKGPFSADANQYFVGTGRVDLASIVAGETPATINLKGGIRCNIGAIAGGALGFRVDDYQFATLGASGNWRFVQGTGNTISLGYRSNLTIDTTDPDTSAAHTITLTDGLTSDGAVNIVGNGLVVFGDAIRARRFKVMGEAKITVDAANLDETWSDIITVDEEMKLQPESFADNAQIMIRVNNNADGSGSVQARCKRGTLLFIK